MKNIYSSVYFIYWSIFCFIVIFSLFYLYFFICSFAISLTTILSVPYSVENFYRLMIHVFIYDLLDVIKFVIHCSLYSCMLLCITLLCVP